MARKKSVKVWKIYLNRLESVYYRFGRERHVTLEESFAAL